MLSVVICSYNGERGLARCLLALAAQHGVTGDAVEVIVVDDGSVDDTAKTAAAAGATVIRHAANRGLAAARNSGLAVATADIVAFVDDDCEPDPSWADALLQAWAAADDTVSVIGGALVPVVPDTVAGRFTQRHDPLRPLELDLAASTGIAYRLKLYLRRLRSPHRPVGVRRVFAVAGANFSVRRSAIVRCGGFDERFRFGSEDLELCRRLADDAPMSPILFDPAAQVRHHFVGTLADTLRRAQAYGRGSARLSRTRTDIPPTVFPAPFAVAALLLATPWRPSAAAAALLLPPALYGSASGDDDPTATQWIDPYLTLAQETAADIGFARSWRAHRFLTRDASHRVGEYANE